MKKISNFAFRQTWTVQFETIVIAGFGMKIIFFECIVVSFNLTS